MADRVADIAVLARKRKVLLVEDHPVVSEGLALRIGMELDLVVCGETRTPPEAMRALDQLQPDVVVVDLVLSEGHGLELIKDLRARHKQIPIVVFTMFDESVYALRSLQAGARGYITKHQSSEQLLAAIRTVLKGEYAVSPQVSTKFLDGLARSPSKTSASPADRLGDRELEVFELIGKGIGTREIATQLGRSVKTIETYRARIKDKLQLKSATALVREAVRWVETRR